MRVDDEDTESAQWADYEQNWQSYLSQDDGYLEWLNTLSLEQEHDNDRYQLNELRLTGPEQQQVSLQG